MNKKIKIEFYSGPKDGLVLYWDDLDNEIIYFEYTSISLAKYPDFANFEYHVYDLLSKDDFEYVFSYSGVSPMEPQK